MQAAYNQEHIATLIRVSAVHFSTGVNEALLRRPLSSPIEASKVDLQIELLSVELICQASLQSIAEQAQRKRLKVSFTLDSAVTILQADERRLKQILVTLLSNAVEFTPVGGTIGLEVMGNAAGKVAYFTVWDTGIGMSGEDVARVFQPCAQLGSNPPQRHAGTNPGLALVYRLAEVHGGSASVESEVGKGSRFTVSLPWKAVEGSGGMGDFAELGRGVWERAPSPIPTRPYSHTLSTVLLVEDDEPNVDAMSAYLFTGGYRVVVARDGAEAIERAREERPDVILMDIRMPGMDGLEAIRRIRGDAALGTVPIITLTALAMPGDRERCLAAGADGYISKPVSLKELVEVIEAQME
jgi:CheY-like chemotaxis protein